MRIIAVSTLKEFWSNSPANREAKTPLEVWYRLVRKAEWNSPADVKSDFGNASILQDGRVVFNIAGNKFRLVVKIHFRHKIVYIRFIGTHAQYDSIDAQNI